MTLMLTETDAATGATVQRPMTDAEIKQLEADREAMAAREAERIKTVQDAQAELKALGLSDSVIATISGYPYPYSPAV